MADWQNQLPTLLGVAIGSLGTLFATTFTDKARWRREQSVRWDSRRVEAYVAYAGSIKEIHAVALRVAAARHAAAGIPIDPEEGLKLLADAELERTKAWEAVLLLGDARTVAAAGKWQHRLWIEQSLVHRDDLTEAQWKSAVKEFDVARDEFYLTARADLALGAGSVAQSGFLYPDLRARPDWGRH